MIAVILKKKNFAEFDQLVTCYSDEMGKSVFAAKSVLRPASIQASHLDILNLVEFCPIEGKSRPIITGAESIETFGGIKKSLKKLAASFVILEVFDKLVPEGERDLALWTFITDFLAALDSAEAENTGAVLKKARLELTKILGYGAGKIEDFFIEFRGEEMVSSWFAADLALES